MLFLACRKQEFVDKDVRIGSDSIIGSGVTLLAELPSLSVLGRRGSREGKLVTVRQLRIDWYVSPTKASFLHIIPNCETI